MQGQFIWYELITSDAKAAAEFYGAVIGWSPKDSGAPGQAYMLFELGDRAIGGMLAITPDMAGNGARPGWLGYVSVNDVDQAAAKIREMSGTVHIAPREIPDVIRFTMAADPQGAVFYAAKGLVAEIPPPLPAGTPGTAGWSELMASDWQAAFAFYEKLFGWTKADAHDMGPMGIYQLFAAGGAPIGGMMTKPPQVPAAHWGYYFNVEAIDAGTERIRQNGGKILNGPMEVPGGMWVVQAMDPQGAAFNLVAAKR